MRTSICGPVGTELLSKLVSCVCYCLLMGWLVGLVVCVVWLFVCFLGWADELFTCLFARLLVCLWICVCSSLLGGFGWQVALVGSLGLVS